MALNVTTDLIIITTAEADTNWPDIGTQSAVLEPDFFVQGSNCMSRAVSNSTKGMAFDDGTTYDFTSGTYKDMLVYIWARVNTPQLADIRASKGLVIRMSSTSATANYREWEVDGSDTIPATDGWICYVIDPQSAGSGDNGTYVATGITAIGAVLATTTTAKGQNLGIDQIAIGRGEIYVTGSVATAGEGFKEIADVAYDSAATNRWGIITTKAGIIFAKGKIILGRPDLVRGSDAWTVAVSSNVVTVDTIVDHGLSTDDTISTDANWTDNTFMQSLTDKAVASVPTSSTFTFSLTQANQGATGETDAAASIGIHLTFSSRGETVVWETPGYDNNTNIVQAIPDASVGGTNGADGNDSYNGIAFQGTGTGTVAIDFGVIVGTDGGRSGSVLQCPENPDLSTPASTLATVQATTEAMALSLYSSTFKSFEGAIDLKGTGIDDDDCFACTFDGCGRIETNMEFRNCNILNSVAIATDGAMIWDDTMNVEDSLFANNSRAIVFEASTGTPFTFTGLVFSGNTYDVRNEITGSDITIDYGTGSLPTNEDVSTSTTTLTGSVSVQITVVDKDDNGIGTAQTALYVGATQVLNDDTNGSGVISGSYTGSTPANAIWKSRKGSTGATKYRANSGPAVIAAVTGLDIKVVLLEDTNNAT